MLKLKPIKIAQDELVIDEFEIKDFDGENYRTLKDATLNLDLPT